MQKPAYGVVTLCVVSLAAFGTLTHFVAPVAPERPPNALAGSAADFLSRASHQEVDWKLLEPESFALARRLGRPVMLVIGHAWSEVARRVDARIFSDPEVAASLNRHFVCVRIDGQERPAWLACYLPLSRPASGVLPGLQVWFLEPSGRVFAEAGALGTLGPVDSTWFQTRLSAISAEFEDLATDGEPKGPVMLRHASDLENLTAAPPGMPDLPMQLAVLRRAANSRFGGFPVNRRIDLAPSAMRFLLMVGDFETLRISLDPLLRSGLVDWVNGGFFAGTRSRERAPVDFDKSVVQNAEAVEVLAKTSSVTGDPIYAAFAHWAFDWLASVRGEDGLFVAAQIGDEDSSARSKRYSFSPRHMRATLDPDEREWARLLLGLRVETNPVMSIAAPDPKELLRQKDRLRAILQKLMRGREARLRSTGAGLLHVGGFATARLAVVARLWGDPESRAVCADAFEKLERYRAGDDVIAKYDQTDPRQPYLGDYLAYADAALSRYLLQGEPDAFDSGLRVLLRARELFQDASTGLWNLRITPPPQPGPANVQAPEVYDLTRESCTAQAIRLTHAYARLSASGEGEASAKSKVLFESARRGAAKLGVFSSALAFFASGYFCAALDLADDAHAFAVGPNARSLADDLFRRAPTRLVAPALGHVRPDLQRRAAGIYVVTGPRTEGPFTVDEAAVRLPAAFTIPAAPPE